MFQTPDDFIEAVRAAPGPDTEAHAAAVARDASLTKPPGALGRLERLAQWYAGWRGTDRPEINQPQIVIFAGNHGVCAHGVSAFPPEVTAQMVLNFEAGGAAINQLAKVAGARLDVTALDLDQPTADFTRGPAMSVEACLAAINAGWASVHADTDLLVAGEMGIGNTTSAAAIACAVLGGAPSDWTGRGTGIDDKGLAIKTKVVSEGLAANLGRSGFEVLQCLGGREIAAIVGAIAAARARRVPVVLDGFIVCAAAACLKAIEPQALDHCVAGHVSAEGAHPALLTALGMQPLLDLQLRLGEASGGALAINVLRAAVACHSGMATFAEAGVATS